jgi:hypothetical protein
MLFFSAMDLHMNYDRCTTVSIDKSIVVRESRSSFELSNPSRLPVQKIQVDGCLIDNDSERCDWLFTFTTNIEIAFYIELKGCDVRKAVSQLGATLAATRDRFKDAQITCYAVTTRYPSQGPSVQRLTKEFYRKYSVPLIVKNGRKTVEIDC